MWISTSRPPHTPYPQSSGQVSQQFRIVLTRACIRLSKLFDDTAGMQHGRVIAATESIADLREAVAGQLLGKRHRYLPWPRNRAAATLRKQISDTNLEVLGDSFLNILNRDQPVL